MYFSFIRNRGQRKNAYRFKFVRIAIGIIIGFIFLKSVLNMFSYVNIVNNGRDIVANIKDKIIYGVFKVVIQEENSLNKYCKKDTNTALSTIIDEGINNNSNLYAYINEKNKEIELAFYDPSYTYMNNSDIIKVFCSSVNFSWALTILSFSAFICGRNARL